MRSVRLIIALVLISLLRVWQAGAQEVLTVEEAVAIALANNYDIQLARNDSAVAALDYAYRNAVFFPRLNANAGIGWLNNNQKQEFDTLPNREGNVATNNLNASLALNWTLFDGLKMFAIRDRAEALIDLGELNLRNQVVNTIAEVIATYYAVVREKQRLNVIEEQIGLTQVSVELAQQRLQIGVGAKPALLQTQVDLNAERSTSLRQTTNIRQLKERLNQLMDPSIAITGSDLPIDYEVVDTIIFDERLELGEIQNLAESNNSSLQMARKNIDLAHINLQERKAERWPIIDFNANYNFNKSNNDIALNPFLPISNRVHGLNYGLTMSVPILNYRNTDRLIRQAELDISYQETILQSQQSQVQLDIQNAWHEYELAREILDIEEENILLARENINIILESYRLGAMTYIELREAQKSLVEAYDRLINARYLTKLAETELLRLKGDLVY